MYDEVEQVASVMNRLDINWYVAGGLCIDLEMPQLTRHHCDIDISFDRRDFHRLIAGLKNQGYITLTRDLLTNTSSTKYLGIFHESTQRDISSTFAHHFIFGTKQKKDFPHLIDLKPYDQIDGSTISYTHKTPVVLNIERKGRTLTLGNERVPLENRLLFRELKLAEERITKAPDPIREYDLQIIKELLERGN
jgi:hypothetical protein